MTDRGNWMQRGLQIVNILLSLLAIIIVSYLVMEYARNTIGGLGYGWVITSISLGLVVGIVIYSMIRLLSEFAKTKAKHSTSSGWFARRFCNYYE